jgi:hypothetical protein
MPLHDPKELASGLSAKLASRSRHVCALLGAGVARACGLPDVSQLQDDVRNRLDEPLKDDYSRQLEGRNLEQALSRLRRIAALITGDETVDGITAAEAGTLDRAVCKAIVQALDVEGAVIGPVSFFAAWAARAEYTLPIELFTVNYDLLLETGLETIGAPYFDGFVGNLRARFRTELVEATIGTEGEWVPSRFVRLWKLHGSVNWAWQADGRIIRLGQSVPEGLAAAIYPSDAKYEESRRVPFIVLQDRFRRALNQPETLMVVSGYSFGDEHLNEMIFDAASRRERNEFLVFCHSDIPDVLAERAIRTPNLQVCGKKEAILAGVRGDWKAPEDELPGVWDDDHLLLPDFKCLAAYLARSSTRAPEGGKTLGEIASAIALASQSGSDRDRDA